MYLKNTMKLYPKSPKTATTRRVFKFSDSYAGVYTSREGHTIEADHRALMDAGKTKRKASRVPHSDAKRRTFKKKSKSICLKKTPGTPYFFTLKPLGNLEPGYFQKAMTGLRRYLRENNAEYIYMLEWAEYEKTPHVHLVANIHGSTPEEVAAFADGVINRWLKSIPKNPATRIKQDARPVHDAPGLFGYISKQSPYEFNARAIATGEDWSVVTVTSCSRGWVELIYSGGGMSCGGWNDARRDMRRLATARGAKSSKRSRGGDAETKRAISEVSSFTVSGLPRAEAERLFMNAEDSQQIKERRFIIEMRDLYRQAHEQGSQEAKDAIERVLLDEGYDMAHMFHVWEKPQMSRTERYASSALLRLLYEPKIKKAKALKEMRSLLIV